MTARVTLDHGPGLRPLTDAQRALVAEHEGLIGWVIGNVGRRLISGSYTADDAWQDGWLGLCGLAARTDVDPARFQSKAIAYIWRSISRGRGIVEGADWRRHTRGRTPGPAPIARSLADQIGDDLTLADVVPALDRGPDDTTLARLELTTAVRAGQRACSDHIDRQLLAWMINPADDRSCGDLATALRRSPQAMWMRRRRLTAVMAAATSHTSERG